MRINWLIFYPIFRRSSSILEIFSSGNPPPPLPGHPHRRGIERRKHACRRAGRLPKDSGGAAGHRDKLDLGADFKPRRRAKPRVLHVKARSQAQILPAAHRHVLQGDDDTPRSASPAAAAIDDLTAQRQAKRAAILRAMHVTRTPHSVSGGRKCCGRPQTSTMP